MSRNGFDFGSYQEGLKGLGLAELLQELEINVASRARSADQDDRDTFGQLARMAREQIMAAHS